MFFIQPLFTIESDNCESPLNSSEKVGSNNTIEFSSKPVCMEKLFEKKKIDLI